MWRTANRQNTCQHLRLALQKEKKSLRFSAMPVECWSDVYSKVSVGLGVGMQERKPGIVTVSSLCWSIFIILL